MLFHWHYSVLHIVRPNEKGKKLLEYKCSRSEEVKHMNKREEKLESFQSRKRQHTLTQKPAALNSLQTRQYLALPNAEWFNAT